MNGSGKPHPLSNLGAAARAPYATAQPRPQPQAAYPPQYRPPQPAASYPGHPVRQPSDHSEIVISPSSNEASPAAGAAGSAASSGAGAGAGAGAGVGAPGAAAGRSQSSGGSQAVPIKRTTTDDDNGERKKSRQALSCSECKVSCAGDYHRGCRLTVDIT